MGQRQNGIDRLVRGHGPSCGAPVSTYKDTAGCGALHPDVCGFVGQKGRDAAIDGKAEFGRQIRQFVQAIAQLGGDAVNQVPGLPEGRDDQVAPRLGLGVGIDQPQREELRQKRLVRVLGHAAQLQVGAVGQVDDAAGMGGGGLA